MVDIMLAPMRRMAAGRTFERPLLQFRQWNLIPEYNEDDEKWREPIRIFGFYLNYYSVERDNGLYWGSRRTISRMTFGYLTWTNECRVVYYFF